MFKKAAWAYAWTGMNTGGRMQVHMRVQLHVCLSGPQSLAHFALSCNVKHQGLD